MRRPGRLTGSLASRRTAAAIGVVAALILAPFAGNRLRSVALGMLPPVEAAPPAVVLRSTEVGAEGPTPTPIGLQGLQRATEPGCCVLTGWLADSSSILVLAEPKPDTPAALMAVALAGGPRTVVWERPGSLSPDGALALEPAGDRVRLTRRSDGRSWTIANAGREPRVSPSGTLVAWDSVSKGILHPDVREHALWVAEITGTKARKLATVIGGGLVGWAEGEAAVIATGRISATGQEGIWAIALDGSAPRLLHQVHRPRDPVVSPSGGWLAFYAAFTGDIGQNGLWVLRTDGTSLSKVTPFGAYRWRAEGRLLLIPMTEALSPTLFEVDPAAGRAVQLTDPQQTSLPISNSDWLVSPDGKRVAFTSWVDRAIWVLTLPTP